MRNLFGKIFTGNPAKTDVFGGVTFQHNPISKEVSQNGIINRSLVEEYPHIYSFPLLSHDYCEFLTNLVEGTCLNTDGIIYMDQLSSALVEQFDFKIIDRYVNKLVTGLTSRSMIVGYEDPYFIEITPKDSSEISIGTLDGDMTLMVWIAGDGGGSLFFPKNGIKRVRALSPGVGCAVLFPSVFECSVTPVVSGSVVYLIVPLIISQETE